MERNYYLKINRKIYYVPSLTPEEFVSLSGQPIENYYKITGKRAPRKVQPTEDAPEPGSQKIGTGKKDGKPEKKSQKTRKKREDQ